MARSKSKFANAGPKTVMEDNFVAPKRRRNSEERVTLQEALADSGETIEELKAPDPADAPIQKEEGQSNLAQTIKQHRHKYVTMIGRNDKKTQNKGDYVAKALLLIPFEELMRFVYLRVPAGKYDKLNPGHQRMCAGNLVRAWWKKGDEPTLAWLAASLPADAELTDQTADEEEAA